MKYHRLPNLISGTFLVTFFLTSVAFGQKDEQIQRNPEVRQEIRHDVSLPLRDIPSSPRSKDKEFEPAKRIPHEVKDARGNQEDPVLQSAIAGPAVATTAGLNFAGVGNQDYGFSPNAPPPDPNEALGPTHYLQYINKSFPLFF